MRWHQSPESLVYTLIADQILKSQFLHRVLECSKAPCCFEVTFLDNMFCSQTWWNNYTPLQLNCKSCLQKFPTIVCKSCLQKTYTWGGFLQSVIMMVFLPYWFDISWWNPNLFWSRNQIQSCFSLLERVPEKCSKKTGTAGKDHLDLACSIEEEILKMYFKKTLTGN